MRTVLGGSVELPVLWLLRGAGAQEQAQGTDEGNDPQLFHRRLLFKNDRLPLLYAKFDRMQDFLSKNSGISDKTDTKLEGLDESFFSFAMAK